MQQVILLREICSYLSAPNDTSQRMHTPFTIWDMSWEMHLTIRKTGNYLDQTIEWEQMSLLKSSRGMTCGRGITDSPSVSRVFAIPYIIPIRDVLEEFDIAHSISDMNLVSNPLTVWQGHTGEGKHMCTLNYPQISCYDSGWTFTWSPICHWG